MADGSGLRLRGVPDRGVRPADELVPREGAQHPDHPAFGLSSSGFGVRDLGFRVQGLGFSV